MSFRTVFSNRLTGNATILQPPNKNRLEHEHKYEGDEKSQHAAKGLVLKYVEPAIGVVESVE
jgi:hypothetical protein